MIIPLMNFLKKMTLIRFMTEPLTVKLVTEIFRVKMNFSPEKMKEVFEIAEGPHVLRMNLN